MTNSKAQTVKFAFCWWDRHHIFLHFRKLRKQGFQMNVEIIESKSTWLHRWQPYTRYTRGCVIQTTGLSRCIISNLIVSWRLRVSSQERREALTRGHRVTEWIWTTRFFYRIRCLQQFMTGSKYQTVMCPRHLRICPSRTPSCWSSRTKISSQSDHSSFESMSSLLLTTFCIGVPFEQQLGTLPLSLSRSVSVWLFIVKVGTGLELVSRT